MVRVSGEEMVLMVGASEENTGAEMDKVVEVLKVESIETNGCVIVQAERRRFRSKCVGI